MQIDMERLRRQQVVLLPCPFQGHINPMLQLGSFLHSKGFSITIIHTHFNSPNPSDHPEFIFQSIQDGLSNEEIASGNILEIILSLNQTCKVPFQDCLAKRYSEDDELICIIHDDLMYFSEEIANQLRIPSIVLRTTSAASVAARLAIIQLKANGYVPFPESMSQELVPELDHLRFKDLPISRSGVSDKYLHLIESAHSIKSTSAVIWNTMDCLEESLLLKQQEKQLPIPIFAIGPIHKFAPVCSSSLLKAVTSYISWLDKQRPNSVLYMSPGSLATINEAELAEVAWGVANSKQCFLWVIRPGSISGSEWIELLPTYFIKSIGEKGCIVKWASQREVLAHPAIGGFWSHCGWNSTLESISEGVPMICRPCFGDQMVNARYVSHVWRIGLMLEDKLERKEIENVVRKLMVEKEGDEMRQRAIDLKEKVEVCFKKGGSSYNCLSKLVEFISHL